MGQDVVTTPLEGFSDSPKDNEIRIESAKLGAGMKISSDRRWRANPCVDPQRGAIEPFVAIAIEPGAEFS